MRMGIGKGRAILLTASLLVLALGAAAAESGTAAAGVMSLSPVSQAMRPAATGSTVTLPAVADQTSIADTMVTPVTIADTDSADLSVTWTAVGLPAGLAIASATGVITGTDTAAPGVYPVTVTATDTSTATATTAFTWTITESAITLTTTASQTSGEDTMVTPVAITATDTAGLPVTWTAAGLPAGLAIAASATTADAADTGVITGTSPDSPGARTVTVTAADATGETVTATFTWTIVRNTVTVTAPRAEQSEVGVTIAPVPVKAKDTAAGQRFTYTASPLPSGLAINHATGVITGRPRTLASVLTKVTVSDSAGSTAAASITWRVGAAITIPDPGGQAIYLGQPVDLPLTASANVARYPLTLRVSGLPPGVGFQSGPRLVSGWPLRAGTYHVAVTATGEDGGITVLRFPITVRPAADGGPAGSIGFDVTRMCLDDPGNRSAVGTRVDIRACDGNAAQQWTMAGDGTVRIHGKCVAIVGGAVRLEGCTASPAQTWVRGTDAELLNPAAGRCLADPGSSVRNGTRPVLASCTASRDEAWVTPSTPIWAGLMGMCADDQFSSPATGTVIDQFSCNGSPAQQWQLLPDGTIRIFGDDCITVMGAAGQVGAQIELFTCTAGEARQSWRIVTHGTFVAQIENGGACLAVPGNTSPDRAQLQLARCSGTAATDSWHD